MTYSNPQSFNLGPGGGGGGSSSGSFASASAQSFSMSGELSEFYDILKQNDAAKCLKKAETLCRNSSFLIKMSKNSIFLGWMSRQRKMGRRSVR